jgi:transposase
LINAIRSHMAEFGIIAASGPQHVSPLIERISDPAIPLPDMVRAALNILADQLVAARLLTIPGVGPITVSAILAGVPDINGFRSGRDFAAWLGLVPRQNSSGGKERLGHITKMGDRTIRRLLVVGAMSTIR